MALIFYLSFSLQKYDSVLNMTQETNLVINRDAAQESGFKTKSHALSNNEVKLVLVPLRRSTTNSLLRNNIFLEKKT